MKANNFIKAIAALLLIGTFASCTKEQQGGNEVSVSENDHTMYVNVAISSSNGLGTKAYDPTTDPDFDKGIPKESEVKTFISCSTMLMDRLSATSFRCLSENWEQKQNLMAAT